MRYDELSGAAREQEYAAVKQAYETWKAKGLSINMARGKPSAAQLKLSAGLLTSLTDIDDCVEDGVDARNYGELCGMPSARRYFADVLGCRAEQIFIGGSASLNLMYELFARAYLHGLLHSESPWSKQEGLKFLCPAPGYDRHDTISEHFGMELIAVPMLADGPDMDMVEELVRDPKVKGMWNVPKFSNPTGIIYSEETVRRLAALRPAAPDFMLVWDNAYCVHEFEGDFVPFPDILSLCEEYGNADMVYEFASTSKMTLPGAGISCLACSEANLAYALKQMENQIICHDKMNQLRQVRFLRDKAHTLELMKQHAAIMKPKFDAVLETLEREIRPLGLAEWNSPKGGYFISLDTNPGLAKRTLALCREAGIVFTNAGATYPHGVDPQDRNVRIAPTCPTEEELRMAMEIFCVSLRLAALEA